MIMQTWQEVDGDNTLALDWPIDAESVVWEIGGYEGRWAAQIPEKYDPHIFIFEPQEWAYRKLVERFEGTKASIFSFGLWTHETKLPLQEFGTDGASVVRHNGRTAGSGDFADIFAVLWSDIDLCLMNVEGAEYVLIPYLLGLNAMEKIRFFWCQFHPTLVIGGNRKAEQIFHGMSRTHRLLWSHYPTAVAWERR